MDVLLIDDHPLMHEYLPALLRRAVAEVTVSAANTLERGLARAARPPAPGLVILDLGLPGYTGLAALTRIRKKFPGIRVAVLSATEDRDTIRAALAAGAAGYIPKTSAPRLIVDALRLVAGGGTYVPREALGDALGAAPSARRRAAAPVLTERQRDVLRLLLKGYGNRRIAAELEIAENTVKQHAHALYASLGVTTRAEAMVAAARRGIRFD